MVESILLWEIKERESERERERERERVVFGILSNLNNRKLSQIN